MRTRLADLWENIRVALDGLLANKLRSVLTMLGVIIGVASVVALLSIGNGASASITSQISSIGTNMLIVTAGGMGRIGGGPGGSLGLTMSDAEALEDPNQVTAAAMVVPQYGGEGQIIYGDSNLNASITGVPPAYQDLYDLTLARGEFISSSEVDKRAKVAVLGATVASDLFGSFNPIGQKIKVSTFGATVSLTVIGVLDEQGGSMLNEADSSIFVPLSTAQTKLFNGRNSLGQLVVNRVNVMAKSEALVDTAQTQIDAVLRDRHGLEPEEDADFRIINQADMLEMATSVTSSLTVFLGAIAGISLLVGGIGIMNIMLVSVTERTREIGLRKAVGARKNDVLGQFLMEAILLSLLGGLGGVLVGIGLSQIVNLTGTFNSVVTPGSILLAVTFSLAIGLFFGIYPANKAAGLNPIEALRYE
ncbi:MAG: FtsX-like permease family protein [Chloroflexi bacterium]|nr:FtsX-like permease family protein [Chloroflexota bacterium]HOS79103.1 ABC transporter permease [Anaerolineae bacterium]HQE98237.1 ABC transporter permease [Anaerolineae bacterium]HQJ10536.1 ABC transporter permease [Anaerolineae bacterium]HUM35330.1 ABC transporter permease [Anaerolineae bacterium]